MSNIILQACGLSKRYGTGDRAVHAVRDASLDVAAGEAVALVGPSGCGKSTLLAMLGLMSRPTAGTVVAGVEAPTGQGERARLRNACFGYLHQDFAIVDEDTAGRNVAIPLEYARPEVGRRARRERCRTALAQVGLEWAIDRRAGDLSGGERQRVAIARALVNEPRVVLADEPTAALDWETASDVITLLLGVRARGAAVLLATHDPRVAEQCDRVVSMTDLSTTV